MRCSAASSWNPGTPRRRLSDSPGRSSWASAPADLHRAYAQALAALGRTEESAQQLAAADRARGLGVDATRREVSSRTGQLVHDAGPRAAASATLLSLLVLLGPSDARTQRPLFEERSAELGVDFRHRHFGSGDKLMIENMWSRGSRSSTPTETTVLDLYFVQGAPIVQARGRATARRCPGYQSAFPPEGRRHVRRRHRGSRRG